MIRYNSAGLAVLSLGIWFVLMLAPGWFAMTWEAYQQVLANVPVQFQAIGISIFCAAALAVRKEDEGPTIDKRIVNSPANLLFFVFCGYCLLLSAFSITPVNSLLFSVMHAMLYLACISFWQSPTVALRFLPRLGLALFAYLLALALVLGLQQRTIGFFPPNDLAKLAMIGATLTLFGGRRLAAAGILLGLLVMLYTQSRGTLIAFLLELSLIWLLSGLSTRKVAAFAFGIALLTAGALVDLGGSPGTSIATRMVDRVLLLTDEKRGTSSGLTGRTQHWRIGLDAWTERPVFGHGLRSRAANLNLHMGSAVNAHSGYLNMLLDVGVVGALLLMTAIAANLRQRLKALRSATGDTDNRRLDIVAFSFIAAALFLWLFEPIYIYIGAPFSVMILLFLAAPVSAGLEQPGTRQPLPIGGDGRYTSAVSRKSR